MSRVLPILFNTDMVRAILDGRKTVTRRVVKKLPDDAEFSGWLLDSTCQEDAKDIGSAGFKTLKQPTEKAGCVFVKPPYQPGDILYVRETWCWNPCWDCGFDTEEHSCCHKTANKIFNHEKGEHGCYGYKASFEDNEYPSVDTWHPSIHMPKEAARIWLKVKDVRVEQLENISDYDAKEEGYASKDEFINSFLILYLKCSVESWLWVISFERVEKTGIKWEK